MDSWITLTIGARQFVVQDAAVNSQCRSGSVQAVVDADDDVERLALLDRGSDNDFRHAGGAIRGEMHDRPESAAAFEDDINIVRSPRCLAWRGERGEADLASIDDKCIVGRADLTVPPAVNRIKGQQMSGHVRSAGDFVDVDEFEVVSIPTRPQSEPSHSPEPVDSYARCHSEGLFRIRVRAKEC